MHLHICDTLPLDNSRLTHTPSTAIHSITDQQDQGTNQPPVQEQPNQVEQPNQEPNQVPNQPLDAPTEEPNQPLDAPTGEPNQPNQPNQPPTYQIQWLISNN